MNRSLDSLSDAELVERCLRREESAWAELVHRYQSLVYAVCQSVGLGREDVEDAFVETFERLIQFLPQLQDRSRVRAWLVTTARRASIDIGRSAARRGHEIDVEAAELATDSPTVLEGLAELEQRHLVHRALNYLDERCRALLSALYLVGERPEYEVVSQRLNMPVGSIGPTRARCLDKLRREFLSLDAGKAGGADG